MLYCANRITKLATHPEQLAAKHGLALIAGTAVMVVGLIFLAVAGRARERDLRTGNGVRSGFTVGLVICIFSGIFSSMLNFSFVFGNLGAHGERRLCRELRLLCVSAEQEPDMGCVP